MKCFPAKEETLLGWNHRETVEQDDQKEQSPEKRAHCTHNGQNQSSQSCDIAEQPHHAQATESSCDANGPDQPQLSSVDG